MNEIAFNKLKEGLKESDLNTAAIVYNRLCKRNLLTLVQEKALMEVLVKRGMIRTGWVKNVFVL